MSMSSLRPPMSAALETRPPNVTLQFLRENIQAAQRKNLPQTEYARAVVLFLCWEHDPITENMHRADLLRLFGSIYGYALEKYEIPGKLGSTIAYERMYKVLSCFMTRHNAKDTLLIVVYHGFAREWSDRCIWLADSARECPVIDWSALRETTLDFAKADVLYIFDCCYTLTSDHGWNYELLAATEVIHTTEAERRHGPNSFTAKLVEILTTLDGEPATVVQIYALLMREAYQGLGGTLTVAPIHRRNSDRTFAVKLQPLHTSLEIPEFRLHELLASAPKALIQASVQQPTPGVEVVEWRQFLMDSSSRIPSLEVTVQAVYQTGYKTWIIHLLVSVDVWALLWDHQPALKFVEFVTLGNIRDSLNFMHGPFETIETIEPSFETEDGLVFIKEEKGLVAIKKEDDSEIDYASDHNIKREASC